MGRIEKTVFISYRRTNFYTALAVYQDLTQNGYDVFFDYQSIDSGDFEKVIIENIKAKAHFLIILSPSALERCKEPGDWLRREIETAIDEKRNIIPLMMEGFDFGSPAVIQALSGKLAELNHFNGLRLYADYFFDGMEKLRNRFLKVEIEDAHLHPLSDQTKEINETNKTAVNEAASVETILLAAEEWFERGIYSTDVDEKIRCYTEAIRLYPDFSDAYYNRGVNHQSKGNLDSAIADYTEAIRIKPDNADYYFGRGNILSAKGNNVNALPDFQKAKEIEPEDGSTRASLVRVLKSLGQKDEAKEQEQIAMGLIEKENEYNRACFESICGNTDKALELLKIGLDKKQSTKLWAQRDPDLENLHTDPRFKKLVGE